MTEADRIINQHAAISLGVGMLPFPVLDMVALSGVQLSMLKRLGDLYEDKFAHGLGNKIIGTLIATLAPGAVASGALGGIIRSVPVVGGILGFLTFPVFASAATKALGSVFKRHYEAGGTVVDFNPSNYTKDLIAAFKKESAAAAKKSPATAK